MSQHSKFSDSNFLKNEQYNTADNLSARIRLHELYSVTQAPLLITIFNQIQEHAPSDASILEIGTGRGDLWKENAHRIPTTWNMTLTDISEGMIRDQIAHMGQALANRMSYDVFDAVRLPYDDNSFDVVVANYMLYHVEDRPQTLAEIRRVLKPEGTLFAATNGDYHMRRLYVLAQALKDTDTTWKSVVADKFSLQNGTAQLMPYFTDIHMKRFQNNLWVTDAQPIIDYIRSMVGIDGVALLAEKELQIRENLNRLIASDGGILIEKETGMFIATGFYDKIT